MCGRLALGDGETHTLSHSAVSNPPLSPWVWNLIRKRAWYLVATSVESIPLSGVVRLKEAP